MHTLRIVNTVVMLVFLVCYSYQFVYIAISLFGQYKPRRHHSRQDRHFAVLICARNEEAVIGELVDSIFHQTYDPAKIKVFVIADNCTDRTAEVAREAGAVVYTRENKKLIGKGYAMDALMNHIKEDYPKGFDAYFVFDADNVLAPDYIERMDDCFSAGNDIVTSYRNSKNYGDNWISAGYGLWFLRESRYLNQPREMMNNSGAVSGTGFMFSRTVADELGGWPFHMLVEDIEFSIYEITEKKRKIAYCREAEFYDEQPTKFGQSFKQRLRWGRGYLQVIKGYGGKMIAGIFQGSFSCFDMSMSIMPAFILTILSIVTNVTLGVWGALAGDDPMIMLNSVFQLFLGLYVTVYIVGLIATITEWKHLRTTTFKKILYTFTFPLFMLTYVPIAVVSLFRKVRWEHIDHHVSVKGTDLDRSGKDTGAKKS